VAQGQDDRPEAALLPGHVLSNRAKLQLEGRTRDLALFNLAIDSKLRGCDLFALRVRTWHQTATPQTGPTRVRGRLDLVSCIAQKRTSGPAPRGPHHPFQPHAQEMLGILSEWTERGQQPKPLQGECRKVRELRLLI
jgi:hypothetical protein